MKLNLTLAAVAAVYSINASAQTERDLESHVHGLASLNIAISDSSVFIELNTPWNNLVGFEHTPNNDEQRAMVEAALQQLNDPTQLFAFNAGDCSVVEVDVESSLSDEHHDEDHEDAHDDEHGDEHEDEHDGEHKDEHAENHEDAHDDEHKEEHAENHEDAHDDEHKEEHAENHEDEHEEEHGHDDEHANDGDESSAHTSVLAIYTYECGQIDDLNTIDASLFSIWDGFKDLDVQLIGKTGQTLVELNPENTVINVDQVQ